MSSSASNDNIAQGLAQHTCRHGIAINGLALCSLCRDEALQQQQAASDKYQAMWGRGIAGVAVQSIPLTAAQHIAEAASHIRQAQEILAKVK